MSSCPLVMTRDDPLPISDDPRMSVCQLIREHARAGAHGPKRDDPLPVSDDPLPVGDDPLPVMLPVGDDPLPVRDDSLRVMTRCLLVMTTNWQRATHFPLGDGPLPFGDDPSPFSDRPRRKLRRSRTPPPPCQS